MLKIFFGFSLFLILFFFVKTSKLKCWIERERDRYKELGCIGSSKATTRRHLYGVGSLLYELLFTSKIVYMFTILVTLHLHKCQRKWSENEDLRAVTHLFLFLFFICSRLDVTFIHAFLSFQFNCHCRYHVSVFVCVKNGCMKTLRTSY